MLHFERGPREIRVKQKYRMPQDFGWLVGYGDRWMTFRSHATFIKFFRVAQHCPFLLYAHWFYLYGKKNMGSLSKVNDPVTNIVNIDSFLHDSRWLLCWQKLLSPILTSMFPCKILWDNFSSICNDQMVNLSRKEPPVEEAWLSHDLHMKPGLVLLPQTKTLRGILQIFNQKK